jgi:hypothetical protein
MAFSDDRTGGQVLAWEKFEPMDDQHGHLIEDGHMQQTRMVCTPPKKVHVSPLGWSITGRLLWAGAASALLWLAVAWAIGWRS